MGHPLAAQLTEEKARGELIIRRNVIVREQRLNARQAVVVEHLLQHSELRIEEFEALCPGVNRRPLQRDLQAMVGRREITASGAARAAKYSLGSRIYEVSRQDRDMNRDRIAT